MKTSCPHCGQHFEVDEPDLGKEADCMNCGKRFVLQASAEPPVSAPPASENTEAKQPEVNCYTGPLLDWDDDTRKFIQNIFLWTRRVVAVICIVIAFYQMYDIRNELKDQLRHEDSAIRATSWKTDALINLMQPIMFMLLALFIKPGGHDAK